MVTHGIVAFMFCVKRDDCQDVLSSFLSPEQALVKNSAQKQSRIEAPSLRIFARAVNHCYADYLPQAQNTGHLRLNTLSLVLLRFKYRRKWIYLPEKTCLQRMFGLISRPHNSRFLSVPSFISDLRTGADEGEFALPSQKKVLRC